MSVMYTQQYAEMAATPACHRCGIQRVKQGKLWQGLQLWQLSPRKCHSDM